jgi:hypothetical protein
MSDQWPHTRVASVRGPEFCCQQCSLSQKRYVEWPCAGTMLLVFSILGASASNGSATVPDAR